MSISNNESVTNKSRADSLMLRFIISYSIFLLIILILFVSIYNGYITSSRANYNLSQKASYVSQIEMFENNLQIMDTTCRQLLQDNNFRRIMNVSSFNDEQLETGHALSNELAVSLYADALLPLKEMYFYLKPSQYILSSSYFISADNFYNWIKKYPAVLNSSWLSLLEDSGESEKFIPLNSFNTSGDKYYMYIIDMNELSYLKSNVSAVFVISKDELQNMFGFDQDSSSYKYMKAIDPATGTEIINLANYNNGDTDVISLPYNDGFANTVIAEHDVTILKYQSPNTGYEYYISFSAYAVYSPTTLLFILIAVAAVALGFAIIIWLSRRNVIPIIEIGEELDHTTEEKEKLQTIVDTQKPIVNQSYVRQLLLSGISSAEECEMVKAHLGIEASTYYKAMHLVVYNNSSDETSVDSESYYLSEEVLTYICNKLSTYLGKPIHYFISGDHSFSVLLDFDESEHKDYLLKVQNAILNVHNALLADYNLWMFAGIGKTTQTLLNVWESYEQAVTAITYTSKNYIFLPYEYIKKDSGSFYYPQEFSNKLVYFVTNGNESQALDLLRLIRKENIEERSLSAHLMSFLLTDIRNSLLKARFELPSSVSDDEKAAIDERFNEKISFPLLEELTSALCKMFTVDVSDGNLIDTIISYIKNNYSDSLLCLNKISDEFNISETYFSHLFKDKTGVNFSTFLEDIRMAKAMELIKSGEISLNEVYEAVGYNNPNSFRRAFKKVYGVTPGSVKNPQATE